MSKIKTTETLKSVDEFINAIANETKRNDSFRIIEILKTQTGFDPKMWGPSIIGFGRNHFFKNVCIYVGKFFYINTDLACFIFSETL